MCCQTDSFCCSGDQRKGIMIAGIIDVALLLALLIMNIVMGSNYAALWFVLVIIADVLLVIGAMKANAGLMMFWVIIGMINIVFLFISWIALPVYAVIVIFVSSVCNGSLQNAINGGLNNLNNVHNTNLNNLNNLHNTNLNNLNNLYNTNLNNLNSWNNLNSNNLNNLNSVTIVPDVDCQGAHDSMVTLFYINMAFVLVLPIYYIYLWVVVKSHRENLAQGGMSAKPA